MMPTHVLTINGRNSFELSEAVKPAADVLARSIDLLDGDRKFALSLWRLPDNKRLDKVDREREPAEYMQCAGSADRLTIEVRERGENGYGQFVVGRSITTDEESSLENIHWEEHVVRVHPSEIFGAAEAKEIFNYYLAHNAVPASFNKRLLPD